jgi:hypothetical protein
MLFASYQSEAATRRPANGRKSRAFRGDLRSFAGSLCEPKCSKIKRYPNTAAGMSRHHPKVISEAAVCLAAAGQFERLESAAPILRAAERSPGVLVRGLSEPTKASLTF